MNTTTILKNRALKFTTVKEVQGQNIFSVNDQDNNIAFTCKKIEDLFADYVQTILTKIGNNISITDKEVDNNIVVLDENIEKVMTGVNKFKGPFYKEL